MFKNRVSMKKSINTFLILILIINPIFALNVGDVNSKSKSKTQQRIKTYKPNNSYDIYYIQQLARTDAQIDAMNNAPMWAIGTFLTSLVATPLLGGGTMAIIAYQSRGNTNVPYHRYNIIEQQYGPNAASSYSDTYSFERGEKQRISNGGGALSGALVACGFFLILLADSY